MKHVFFVFLLSLAIRSAYLCKSRDFKKCWNRRAARDHCSSLTIFETAPIKKFKLGTCIPDPDGGTKWYGIMSAIVPLIPGVGGFVSAIFGIVSSIDFGHDSDYYESVNECVKRMINLAIEDSDLQKCKQSMNQIEVSKKNFLWAVKQNLSNQVHLDNVKEKIQDVNTEFKKVQNNFAQKGIDPTNDRHHEKFLDFTLDALGTLGSLKLILVNELQVQEVSIERSCVESKILLHDMESMQYEMFNNKGTFSFKRIIDDSPFAKWHESIWYNWRPETDVQNWYRPAAVFIKDEYRETGTITYEYEIYDRDIPKKIACQCDWYENYAIHQMGAVARQIRDGSMSFQNMIIGIKHIRDRLGCKDNVDGYYMARFETLWLNLGIVLSLLAFILLGLCLKRVSCKNDGAYEDRQQLL